MWTVCTVGILGCLFAMIVGFLPPSQLNTGNLLTYELFLIGGTLLFCLIPFAIYAARKPEWKRR